MALPVSRPILASVLALALSACSGIENDPNRFESMARAVAAIDVPMTPVSRDAPSVPALATAAQSGLRPALQVQVMDPHDLWDARDGAVETAVRQAVVRTAVETAPVVTQAVVRQASQRAGLRPALPAAAGSAVIQLGAFSSEAAARAAWAEIGKGGALSGLSPRFEAVEVNGKRLTRLKVGPIPAAAAAGLCRSARVSDPWCRRGA
jgi:hypothetical protein